MDFLKKLTLIFMSTAFSTFPCIAQTQDKEITPANQMPPDVTQSSTSSSSSSSSTREIIPATLKSKDALSGDNATIVRKFVPKFKERLNDLADQVKMAQGKNWITADEAAKFMERQSKLLIVESEASKKGFPKADVDSLEREVTQLNGDLFKAMRKTDPVKPGQADKEVNAPNLIPAYTDPELQPNSGK